MDNKKRVRKWLEYCESNKIKPWEFDFKHVDGKDWLAKADDDSNFSECIITGDAAKYATSNLRLEIAYKSSSYSNTEVLPQDKNDCDKKAIPMYDVLGWQESEVLGPDTMNSFQTTLTFLIRDASPFSENNKQVWSKDLFKDPIPDLYAELITWAKTDKVIENLKIFINSHYKNDKESATVFLSELETFAGLTHSIGNFIVLPEKISSVDLGDLYINNRGKRIYEDYWDCALIDLHEKILKEKQDSTSWKEFIERYYLQPFVAEDYVPKELWKGHFENGVMPKKIEDFEQFYHNANLWIEERGKKITEKLYEIVGRN